MRVLILFVAASAILHGTDAAGKEKKGHKETTTQSAGASESRSPYSTDDVVSARKSGRFTLEFVMKAAADGSGGGTNHATTHQRRGVARGLAEAG